MKPFLLQFIGIFLFIPLRSQELNSNENKMEWFADAKLGIFIHWGIYSVNGISESWSFFNNYINHENYMKQLDGFTASNYRPEDWVQLIKNSGAKYAVITSRHHDGVSLWDSKANHSITIPKNTPAQKDVLTPFVSELKKAGLRTGLYYSLPDWSHPDYDVFTRTQKRYELSQKPEKWQDFIQYYRLQLHELMTAYQPDLLWFDGDWEHNPDEWKSQQTLNKLRQQSKNIIVNSRLSNLGDYLTPEQGVPVVTPESQYWELCYTMNDSWGYQPVDINYKSSNMLIRTLVDCISMGGNLLLSIGPKEDGTIPEVQIQILKDIGRWTSKHAEAIYGTRRGIPFENFRGKSSLSKDKKTLYLYVDAKQNLSKLFGILSKPKKVEVIGSKNSKIQIEDNSNELTLNYLNVEFDPDVTVIKIEFDEPIKLQKNPSSNQKNLVQILNEKDAKKAVYSIANQLFLGNNLLTNNGITEDGLHMQLPLTKQSNSETVSWISKHAEALYETGKGLPDGHFGGMSALSKDRQTLYLFVDGKPTGPISVKGLQNEISRIRIVGEGSILSHEVYNKLYWSKVPGIVYINIPEDRLDKDLTVIAILLDKPIEVFREKIDNSHPASL